MELTPLGIAGRVIVVLSVLLLGGLYARGLRTVRNGAEISPKSRAPYTFFAGLIILLLALTSRLEANVSQYFTARAFQHLLLTELIPLLILSSDPYPVLRLGLPQGVRRVLRPIRQSEQVRRVLTMISAPGVAWVAFVSVFWFWHDDLMLRATERFGLLHAVEVLSLLFVAGLYWWHIAAASPHFHKPMRLIVRLFYAFIGIMPIKLTGVVMLFNNETVVGGYRVHDATVQTITYFGRTLPDLSAGAIIIWVAGGVMYAIAAIILGLRFIGREEEKPPLPVNPLERDDLWVIPARKNARQKRFLASTKRNG